jgi:spermidine synthase
LPPEWLVRAYDGSAGTMFVAELALTAGALLLPAVLMGLCFPLLVAEVADGAHERSRRVGWAYAVNTLGCVAGAILTGFVLIPGLGIHGTFGLVVALVGFAGVAALLNAERPGRYVRVGLALSTIVLGAVSWQYLPVGQYLKSAVVEPRKLLYYREGDTGTVTVVESPPGARAIMVDGQPVAGTAASSVVDQKMLAHLPLLLHPAPTHALTVGFGSGGTSHSMTLHGAQVDCVEIERAVPEAAGLFLSENQGVRSSPKFHLVLDDARSWLRVAPYPYDVIVTDCTNLQYKSSGDLYTVEYFDLMRRRLSADGIAAAWVPANGIAPSDLKTLVRSFQAVFPHTSIWHMNRLPTDFLIFVGTPGPLSVDLGRLATRMADPRVRSDLQTVGLEDPARLLATCLTSEEGLPAYLGTGPLHTDDRPILSYSTYGAAYRSTIAANLLQLLACRSPLAHLVTGTVDKAMLLRHEAASTAVELGHIAWLRGAEDEALGHYATASRLLPEDEALRRQLTMLYLNHNPPPGQAEECQEAPPEQETEHRPLTGW